VTGGKQRKRLPTSSGAAHATTLTQQQLAPLIPQSSIQPVRKHAGQSVSQADLRAAPVATLRVVPDAVVRAHANPLGNWPVLLQLLGQRLLGAESLVARHPAKRNSICYGGAIRWGGCTSVAQLSLLSCRERESRQCGWGTGATVRHEGAAPESKQVRQCRLNVVN